MKRFHLMLLAGVLIFAACSDQPSGPDPADNAVRKAATEQGSEDFDLKDRYIVVFKRDVRNVDALIDEVTRGKGAQIHYRYQHSIRGFCATIPPQALEGIRRNPNVDYIEADGIMSINTVQPVTSALWGLDRIDQRALPLSLGYEYLSTGTGVTVYIIDTGILYGHVEFGNPTRATFGYDAFGSNGADLNGHGTHVAGTVGGSTVGVAKAVNLISVRVLDRRGSGTTSGVIDGVDWVASHHSGTAPAVANMSLGGGPSISLDQAVQAAIADGVTFAVAAGNDNALACNYSPARVPEAITVGSTTNTDARSSFSNYGSCVDVFAPGSSIYSAYKSSTTSYTTMSGTSMASPHVAGVAALYLQNNPSAPPATVVSAISSTSTSGVLSSIPSGTPNLLVYSLLGSSSTPTAPNAPSNLSATVGSPTSVNLTWQDNSSNEDGFKVEYADNSSFTNPTIVQLGQNTQSCSVTGLTTNSTYWFRVFAFNTIGASGYSNSVSATLVSATSVGVASAVPSTVSVRNNWTARLAVTIKDANGNGIPYATVTLSWSGGASGTSSATTDVNGYVMLSTSSLNKNVAYVDLSITNVTGSNLTYDQSLYPSVTFPIRVNKP
ncbi:MAG: S8 family serine peptidase [Bacteroidia bacterium]|nr:S8 family serine peptidase [Bacteroidia bacterium]